MLFLFGILLGHGGLLTDGAITILLSLIIWVVYTLLAIYFGMKGLLYGQKRQKVYGIAGIAGVILMVLKVLPNLVESLFLLGGVP